MINIDSFWHRVLFLSCVCFSSGCTTSDFAAQAHLGESIFDGTFDRNANPMVAAFQQTCLSENGLQTDMAQLALANGWRPAEEKDLDQAKLRPLRKLVLAIPGGGARFSEEQLLFSRGSDGGLDILNLERRYVAQETLASQCDVYGSYDFLKSCEAVGKLLKRAPDHNQAYPQNGAHFIRWDIRLQGKKAVISCDKTPNSKTLPYSGISLSLKIDETAPVRTMASPVRKPPISK